jgi:hypothetical protein
VTLDRRVTAQLKGAGRQIFAAHRGDLNFTGCGVGFRRRGGTLTDEPAVVAMVIRKRPEASVSRWRLLPRTIEVNGRAWGVDVVEAGPLTASGAADVPMTGEAAIREDSSVPITQQLIRPPELGCSISNVNQGHTGTLGCFAIDNTDGTVCLVSSAHVLTRFGQASPGESIIQPALGDGGLGADDIAFLKTSAMTGSDPIDVAIAQLVDQTIFSPNAAGKLMAPISPSHPAVGLVVADDSAACGRSVYLSPMNKIVSRLNLTLIGATSGSSAVAPPTLLSPIEKVGRTSLYTSGIVDVVNVIIKVNYGGTVVTLADMIWTQGMSLGGDSGAVACAGGNGATYAPLPAHCTNPGVCALIDAFATYYNLPLTTTANVTLVDEIRDQFLAMSNIGQLLIGAVYLNAQTAIDRLNSGTGPAHNQAAAQVVAQTLYAQYRDLIAKLVASSSPAAVVAASDVNAAASILFGLAAPVSAGGTAMLTSAESAAAWTLFSDVVKPAVGMDRQQLIDYMNKSTVFQQVNDQLAAIPTIRITGPVSAD